ncbi:MAG TPA: hypothetical protein PLD82_02400 [Spirochaetota bacterium]|nr:hypothetical protein [Spirochaetota bacterium]HPH03127.1 hypothetical protein [Spirochaetota bacterium]
MDEQQDLNFEYGDPLHPKGNALAYWKLTAHFGDESFEKLIVTNFVISPMYIGKQSVAATFPPQLVDSLDDLVALAHRAEVDLIRVREVDLPAEEFDFESFFKQQLSHFNRLVAQYTEQYGQALGTEDQPEIDAEPHDELTSLQNIIRLAEQARQAFLIQHNAARARETLLKIRRMALALNSPTYKYDVEELLLLLNNPDSRIDDLSHLYFQKFMAICTEQYEEAARLKQSIRRLAKRITVSDLPGRESGPSPE